MRGQPPPLDRAEAPRRAVGGVLTRLAAGRSSRQRLEPLCISESATREGVTRGESVWPKSRAKHDTREGDG